MRQLILLFLFSFFTISLVKAQTTCNCQADLDFIYPLIKKTPAYKDQIKGAKKLEYAAHFQQLKKRAGQESTLYECFQYLMELLDPIQDNHMYIRGEGPTVTRADLTDTEFMDTFRESPAYQVLPELDWDLSDLEKQLKQKALTDLEGIYYYRDVMKIGLTKAPREEGFYGVVLESGLPSWKAGEVMLVMKPIRGQRYQVITGRFMSRTLLHFEELVGPGLLYTYGWSKITNTKPHFQRIYTEERYDLLEWSDKVQYLRLGSFSSNTQNVKRARAFANSLEGQLNAPHVVLDLRGNTGGARKVSLPFYKVLKHYQKTGKLWVLTNYRTVSNAEQFTLKLKSLPNTSILGLRTNGTLSYGRNYSNDQLLPSGYFSITTTDMDFSKFLPYEGKGIMPDTHLDPDADWKEQVLKIINK